MKIAIIGAGAYGTALGEILSANKYEVAYYDPFLLPDVKMEDVLYEASEVLLVAPSAALPELLPALPKNRPLIVATKGILDDKVFADFQDVAVISGPGFADDIKAGKETFLTVTDERLMRMFGANFIKFDYTEDVRGVLMCGALKNVYAVLAGYLGLLPGGEGYEDFISEVTDEMEGMLVANGAQAETVDLYCGVGDLRLTCDTPSRNYQYGVKLSEDALYQPEVTVEGVSVLKAIRSGVIKVPEGLVRLSQVMDIVK